MPRTTDSTLLAAISAPSIQFALFAEITFATSTVYVWSGVGSITWNGQTWTGIGSFLGLEQVEDNTAIEPKGIAVLLSGLDATLLPAAMTEFQLGLPATILLGVYSGGSLYGTPFLSWSGLTDLPSVDLDGKTATITVNCESPFVALNNAVDRRYTTQDQQMTWPGDLGLQFVDSIQEITTYWMQYPNNTNNV